MYPTTCAVRCIIRENRRGKKKDRFLSTEGGINLPRATYEHTAQKDINYNNLNKMFSCHILRTLPVISFVNGGPVNFLFGMILPF
jgi:hypothetical protein